MRDQLWSNLLHFLSGLAPEPFKLASGKGKRSGEPTQYPGNISSFFFFPKGNPGRISCATVLERQDWYKREAWCGCDYFIEPNWRHLPALVGGWATPVGPACLFKATRVVWPRVLAQRLVSTEWRFGRGWNPWSLCSLQELVGHKFIFHPGEWTTESTGWNHQPWLLLSDLVYILNPLWEQL